MASVCVCVFGLTGAVPQKCFFKQEQQEEERDEVMKWALWSESRSLFVPPPLADLQVDVVSSAAACVVVVVLIQFSVCVCASKKEGGP